MTDKAITAAHVKEHIETFPELSLPSGVTDPMIEEIIRRKTSHVLTLRGLSSLPSAGHELDLVENWTLELVLNEMARRLTPDNAEMLDALRRERERIERDIQIIKESSPTTGLNVGVV